MRRNFLRFVVSGVLLLATGCLPVCSYHPLKPPDPVTKPPVVQPDGTKVSPR